MEENSLSTSLREADRVLAGGQPTKPEHRDCGDVLSVFDHYRKHHPKAHPKPKADSKEWRAIKARFAEGYTVNDLCQAIDGLHMTPHNLGENDRNQQYLGLELCMRSGSQVERFRETAEKGPPLAMSTREAKGKRAGEQWLEMHRQRDMEAASAAK